MSSHSNFRALEKALEGPLLILSRQQRLCLNEGTSRGLWRMVLDIVDKRWQSLETSLGLTLLRINFKLRKSETAACRAGLSAYLRGLLVFLRMVRRLIAIHIEILT